jgi:hypothetical protein
MVIPVAHTPTRGNPNWGRPMPPASALATEFELRVRQQQLTLGMYVSGMSSACGVSKTGIEFTSPNGYLRGGIM